MYDPNYQPYPPPRRGMPGWAIALLACGGIGCLGVVGLFAFLYVIGRNVVNEVDKIRQDSLLAAKVLKVQESKLVKSDGSRFIVGTLKNTSPIDDYRYVTVKFRLLDKEGASLGLSQDGSWEDMIKHGSSWRFKVPVKEPDAVKYELAEVTGDKLQPGEHDMTPEAKAKLRELRESEQQSLEEVKKTLKDRKD